MLLLAFLAGALTIVSPCILPVLPFVFARADRPFLRNGLPMLGGMAVAFAAVGTLASVVGGWAVEANRVGRSTALVLLALFGLSLLLPSLAGALTRPLVALGDRLVQRTEGSLTSPPGVLPSIVLGVATGLLWAPCAGPVLGLILGAAALEGASTHTTALLLTYALGAITSLALALLAGGRVFAAMKRSLHAAEWLRRALGAAVLIAVAVIAFGVDAGLLTRVSLAGTTRIEQYLIDRIQPHPAASTGPAMAAGAGTWVGANPAGGPAMAGSTMMGEGPAMAQGAMMQASRTMGGGAMMSAGAAMSAGSTMHPDAPTGSGELAVEDIAPSLAGAGAWINSAPLTLPALRGKVVLIDFWTYSCINCLRAIPYVRAWASRYADEGLTVIGVHTPEFAFEKSVDNVRAAVKQLGIGYPVVMDNDYAIWRAFGNQFWPAHYFIDAQGHVRHHHFGEGGYAESEQVIRRLLAEAGHAAPQGLTSVQEHGISAASDVADVLSPETYVGYERAQNFVSPAGAIKDLPHTYTDGAPRLNEWGLTGTWTIGPEQATLDHPGGTIVFGFHARDLHLVLGPPAAGTPVRFRVTLDGVAPGDNHGVDVDAQGYGVVNGQRLFQLIRQQGEIRDRHFEIRFLDSGVRAYAFTFG